MYLETVQAQIRVVVALAIRDAEAEYARFRLGYLWAFAQPVIYVSLLTALTVFVRRVGVTAHDMTPVLFVVFGTLPWIAFSRTMGSMYRIIYANKHVLQLPGATTFDVIAAHALVEFVTYNAVFIVFVTLGALYENSWPPRNILSVILVFNSALALGCTVGMALIPVHRFFPAVEHFMIIFLRAGFWTAGLFFVISQVPNWALPYFTWNPMLHVTELLRTYWFDAYQTPVGNPWYIVTCIVVFGLIGLAADRLLRRAPV